MLIRRLHRVYQQAIRKVCANVVVGTTIVCFAHMSNSLSHYTVTCDFISTACIQVLSVLDDHLAKRTFLVGQRITLADIVVAAKLSEADLSPQSRVYNVAIISLICFALDHMRCASSNVCAVMYSRKIDTVIARQAHLHC